MIRTTILISAIALATSFFTFYYWKDFQSKEEKYPDRAEVVFWHFWGGADREVVEDVVGRFNSSQEKYYVRPIAMPGNNLNMKLLASVAGGNPPDLVNIDDPVIGDWAEKTIIEPLESFVDEQELKRLDQFLVPPARKLSYYKQKHYGVCNGLDLRALFINKTALDNAGYSVPKTTAELQKVCFDSVNPDPSASTSDYFPYLPDSRRLWSWGYVFNGSFYDEESKACTVTGTEIENALRWMRTFPEKYGAETVSKFRAGDQSLPGKRFPILPSQLDKDSGRYWMIQDGQWRVRDLMNFNSQRKKKGLQPLQFVVQPLPSSNPKEIITNQTARGWVNGNVFIVPKRSNAKEGAWEFMKFWIGLSDPRHAVETCRKGGWIPVSKEISHHPQFQSFLDSSPMFRSFVEMSESPNWKPIPVVPGAGRFKREIELMAGRCFQNPQLDIPDQLDRVQKTLQSHLQRSIKPSRSNR